MDVWSDSINKAVLKRLKSVRRLYLSLGQLYCECSVEFCGYERSEMTKAQSKMFKKLRKLPLREATLIIDDRMFLKLDLEEAGWPYYDELELHYRVSYVFRAHFEIAILVL